MKQGQQEDKQLTQYLNKLLDELPLHEPGPDLTDRIMQSLQAIDTSKQAVTAKRSTNRPLMNGAIAIAATVLFIQSGVISRIMNIAAGISELTDYIHNLSQNL